jgi:thioredoxin reductase (NADPH)
MPERARAQENIEFVTPYRVAQFVAGENGALGHAELVNTVTGAELQLPVSGTFIAVGHEPQSALIAGQIDVDENGYVITDGKSTRTNRPGVFAAGDLVDHTYRQAITAAGSGCQAALDAEWYLRDTPFPLDREESDAAATAAQR